jgi:N-acetylglucosamine-6-phosphate deacetylase
MTTRRFFGRAFTGGAIQDDVLLTIRDGVIAAVEPAAKPPADAERTDAVIAPGFVDVHVHGGDGADFMDADATPNARILEFHARNGTTALAATTLSASPQDLRRAVTAIAHSSSRHGAEICAIHLEGPYINPIRAGAQDRASIRPASIHEINALLPAAPRLQWMMTIAPEIAGAQELIEYFRGRIRFSIGHTAADYAQAVAALEWGASHFTHLFNAMTPLQHREPGVVGAALESVESTAELIADGIHVHPAVLRIATLAKPHHIALVTDAMRACGMPDGDYKLYGYDVTVSGGAARMADGTLAGSVLTTGAAVRNMIELAGLPIEVVLPLATEVPARILGVGRRKGRIEKGFDADLVLLGSKLEIERVIVRGEELA